MTKPVVAIVASALAVLVLSTPALAASSKPGPVATTGNDISYPQCLASPTSGQAFGIVGVNAGLANTTNPCLAQQLAWAASSTGITTQPRVSLYVNTGNPGDLDVLDWPRNNIDPVTWVIVVDPYGACSGADDQPCAWQYGWNMASLDAQRRGVLNASTYVWWLDVETGNSWESNTANNVADLEGMVAYFRSIDAPAGIYSTGTQWRQVAGTLPSGSSLNGIPSWIPGAVSPAGAEANCGSSPLTLGGRVAITQWTPGSGIDGDYDCTVVHQLPLRMVAE